LADSSGCDDAKKNSASVGFKPHLSILNLTHRNFEWRFMRENCDDEQQNVWRCL